MQGEITLGLLAIGIGIGVAGYCVGNGIRSAGLAVSRGLEIASMRRGFEDAVKAVADARRDAAEVMTGADAAKRASEQAEQDARDV